MIKAIIKQAPRINGHVAWLCKLADGTTIALTVREIMCFNRRPA